MTMTDDRESIICPSWCTNPAGHEQPDSEGVVWHEQVVLDLPLPEMSATDQLGRCGVGTIEVRITQYVNVPAPVDSMPGVMVSLTTTDYADAVLLTADEAERVGQAVSEAGRLIGRNLDR